MFSFLLSVVILSERLTGEYTEPLGVLVQRKLLTILTEAKAFSSKKNTRTTQCT